MAAMIPPRSWLVCAAAVTLLLFPLPAGAWKGEVVALKDARALVVEQNGRQSTVTLYAMRVPQMDEPFGEEAYAFSRALILGRSVEVEPQSSRKKGALVYAEGESESVNAKLLRQGWGWIEDAYCEKAVLCGRLNKVQAEAERAKRGIWSEIPEDTPPWRWLREHGE
ncbi:MAG: thermonuclease family protein [Desulfohalobiaceae bacterium]|nr:thermonuclease family protein [Desulfohalobiaceae bacterium]